MKIALTTTVCLLAALLAQPAQACFLCEEGAYTTAIYTVVVFGLAFAGMLLVCIAYARAGAFKTSNQTELTVLAAEGLAAPRAKDE